MFNKLTWYLLLFIAVAGFAGLTAGFFQALEVTGGSSGPAVRQAAKIEKSASGTAFGPKKVNTVQIVVLGDSIARGTGDEKGKGFSAYLPENLKNQTSKDLQTENVAIDGLETAGLLEQLHNSRLKALLSASDLVVLSIGGNDLRSLRALDETTKTEEFKALEAEYLKNLQEILQIIRKANLQTQLVFVGLYNPYEQTGGSFEDTKLLQTWNADTQRLVEADPRAVFIPTYDLFKLNLSRFVAPDGLHPNSLGYQAISSRISKSIETVFNSD